MEYYIIGDLCMNKKIKKSVILMIIFSILTISLTGCANQDENQIMSQKVGREIEYLELRLVDMLNNVNGISLYNYIVEAEQISKQSTPKSSDDGNSVAVQAEETQQSSSSSGQGQSQGESSQQGQSQDGNSGQGQSQGGGSQQGQSGSSNSSQGQGGSGGQSQSSEASVEGSNNSNVLYKMAGNEILLQNRQTDWTSLKSDIEKLYSDWSTIQLDLYKMNVNSQEVLNFSSDLDMATAAIKSEDKAKTLTSLAKLYSYIPTYASASNQDTLVSNVYKTKSNLLTAYSVVEQDDFSKVEQEMKNAEQSFMPIINDVNSGTENQVNINKAYVLIKELQNFSANRDKDIFYIKYKNVMQELINL